MKILVTGAAGFIGYHLVIKLIAKGFEVIGLDNINDYYNTKLKIDRLKNLGITKYDNGELCFSNKNKLFSFIKGDLKDRNLLESLFDQNSFDIVCNLAAQAGVRYSLKDPYSYIDSNINGFINLLECCRHNNVKKMVYASSSSVYGLNKKVPFTTMDSVDKPISIYAATKRSNELMAYTYSHLFGLKTIGLRFFTVYGPWGRPDMAMFLFTDAIFNNRPIKIFNKGNLSRDFTYIDDIVDGVVTTISRNAKYNNQLWQLYNIGNSKPIKLMDFISSIEKYTGKQAIREYLPMQPGDVESTWADVTDLEQNFDYKPKTDIDKGVRNFVEWYRKYYKKT